MDGHLDKKRCLTPEIVKVLPLREAIEFTDGAFNEEKTPDVLYEWRPEPRPLPTS